MKIISVASARPNFVKLAAVHHALAAAKDVAHEHIIVHTGQHFDPLFSDVFFHELQIPLPNVNLEIHGGKNEEQQQRVEAACREVFAKLKPDIVLVYGDVNGAVAAARAAAALGFPVGHVEAGLRSFDLSMPEEGNRIAIDRLSSLLFMSEQSGMDNAAKEQLQGNAYLVGNTMIDTLIRMLLAVRALPLPAGMPERFALVTLHRPSNVDDPAALASIVDVLRKLRRHIPLVFPVHLRTKARLRDAGLWAALSADVQCIDPLPYMLFLRLVLQSHFVLTDSGGIQEETTYLRKKCFTARPNTERPSTIRIGSNELVDLQDRASLQRIAAWADASPSPVGSVPPLWDGRTGDRIVSILSKK